MAVLSIGQMWADEVVYTLDGTSTGGSSGYAAESDITQSGISWKVMGNTTMNPWRIGGKSITNVVRTAYSTNAISDNITKVVVSYGTFSLSSASAVLKVYSTAEDAASGSSSNLISTVSGNNGATPASNAISANATHTFTRPDGDDWSGRYFRFEFTCTYSSNDANKFFQFKRADFYKAVAADVCAIPTFSKEAGNIVAGTQVTISTETEGAVIRYTTNGDTPDENSTLYEGAITVNEDMTINAIAIKSGYTNSSVASVSYTALTPYTTIAAIFENATSTSTPIYVTFDGWKISAVKGGQAFLTDGTNGLIIYQSGHGFSVGDALTGTAACNLVLFNGSAELTGLTKTSTGLTVTEGSMSAAVTVNIADISEVNTGALVTIENVTYDGTYLVDASSNSIKPYNSLYSGMTFANGKKYNVTGIANYYNAKQIMPRSVDDIEEIVEASAPATPTFSVAAGTYTSVQSVELSCETDGATIYYTTDGSTPDDQSTEYTAAINVDADMTIKAVAYKAGVPSAIASAAYVINLPLTTMDAIFAKATTVGSTATDVTIVLNNWVVSGIYTNNKDVFVTDGTKGFIIYDGGASMGFNVGDVLSGTVACKVQLYKGAAEVTLLNSSTTGLTITSGGSATLDTKTIDQLGAINTGALVTIENLTYDGTNKILSDGTSEIAPYKGLFASMAFEDGKKYNVTGVVGYYDVLQIMPRSADDIEEVNTPAPVLTDYYEKVTATANIVEGTYLIVYEGESVAFDGGLDDSDDDHKLDKVSNTIDVDITADHKIGVTTATEAATFYIDVTAGTIQAASGKYIGVTSNSNGLKTSDNANAYSHTFAIDGDGNAVIGAVFSESTMTLRYNADSGQKRFRYYKTTSNPAIQLYKLANEVVKASPELTWSAESVELTVGDDFTSPTFTHADGLTETITFSSDKESVATVDANGVISLVADATGTAHITASYPGDANFKAEDAVCTIKVNPAHSIYVSPSLTVNFGSVVKDATVDDKVITVTLTEVPAATAALGGDNPEAFSITPASPAALTESGDITISVASTATVGTYNATLTISDDADLATTRVVTLKLTVTEPSTEETAISTSTQWVAAEAADIKDGAVVLITGVKDDVTYAIGVQNDNNRAAVAGTLDEGVFTPGDNTMAFTLVAQEGGTFALRASNGEYLYAASSSKNYLKRQATIDDNAKWTLTATSAVANGTNTRNDLKFNGTNSPKIFSCYGSPNTQTAIQFYVPKQDTPEPPTPVVIRDGLENGKWGTLCPKQNVENVEGAVFYQISYLEEQAGLPYNMVFDEIEGTTLTAGKPYFFIATGAEITGVKTGTELTEADAAGVNGFYGYIGDGTKTLSVVHANYEANADNTFVIYNNSVFRLNAATDLKSERCYININASEPSRTAMPKNNARRRITMNVQNEQVVTGIDALNASEQPVKMIIDGQLFIIRGEKMYNVNGQVVK